MKAGIDRRHFQRYSNNDDYKPNENIVVSLALALELNTDETDRVAGLPVDTRCHHRKELFDCVVLFA